MQMHPIHWIHVVCQENAEILYPAGVSAWMLKIVCFLVKMGKVANIVFSLDLVEFNSRIHERIHQKAAIVLNRDQLQGMCENEIFCRKMHDQQNRPEKSPRVRV